MLADGAVLCTADTWSVDEFCAHMALIERALAPRGIVVVVPDAESNDPLALVCRMFGPTTPWQILHTLDWATTRRSAPHISANPLQINSDRVRVYVLARTADVVLAATPAMAMGGHEPVYRVRDSTLRVLGRTAADRRLAALIEIVQRYWVRDNRILVPIDDAADTVSMALANVGCVPVVAHEAGLAPRPPRQSAPPPSMPVTIDF